MDRENTQSNNFVAWIIGFLAAVIVMVLAVVVIKALIPDNTVPKEEACNPANVSQVMLNNARSLGQLTVSGQKLGDLSSGLFNVSEAVFNNLGILKVESTLLKDGTFTAIYTTEPNQTLVFYAIVSTRFLPDVKKVNGSLLEPRFRVVLKLIDNILHVVDVDLISSLEQKLTTGNTMADELINGNSDSVAQIEKQVLTAMFDNVLFKDQNRTTWSNHPCFIS